MNLSKTEVLWCASGRSGRRQHQIPTSPVRIGSAYVLPVSSVRDLGVHIDSDVSLRTHVTATVRSCFGALRQIRSVRRCLPQHALLTLIRALVPARSTTAAPCWSVSPVIYTRQAAVHPQRCRPTRVLSQGLRTHHPASPQPSLVAGPGTDSIPSLRSGIPMSQWISAAISR